MSGEPPHVGRRPSLAGPADPHAPEEPPSPFRATFGIAFALAAAVTFGVTAPVAKYLLATASPLALAGLLYAGGGVGLALASAARRSAEQEARLRAADVPFLLGAILLGGVIGPVLMLFGFQRISGISGALLLNLEAPVTATVATLLFKEHLGKRGLLALGLVVAGGVLLGRPSQTGQTNPWGALAVLGACSAWGIENNLMTRLAQRDPWSVARTKMLAAGVCSLFLLRVTGGEFPEPETVGIALIVGAWGYGASNVLALKAMRELGAARQATLFASAPFIGAVAAIFILHESPDLWSLSAGALMLAGIALLIAERHAHRHRHAPVEHDHAHTHEDQHHGHPHTPPVTGTHAHPHQHEPVEHEHPHTPDAHHRHEH
ncbi:MAG: EamA family transporter [Myxococcales bacterium]